MMSTLLVLLAASVASSEHIVFLETRFQPLIVQMLPPDYPLSDQRLGVTGVVVLQVMLDSNLHLEQVTVLEAPSASLGKAAVGALDHWTVAFPSDSLHLAILTKLTFYFSKCRGKYAAYYSRDAPNPVCRQ